MRAPELWSVVDISSLHSLGQKSELTRPTNEPPTTIIFLSEVDIFKDEVLRGISKVSQKNPL